MPSPSPLTTPVAISRTLLDMNGDVVGGNGDDQLALIQGRGNIIGGNGNDTMVMLNAEGTMSGGYGNDTMRLTYGRAYIDAGIGNDLVLLNHGEGTVIGGAGNDTMVFDFSRGRAVGGDGNDRITYRNSDGIMDGGAGCDILTMTDSSGTMRGGAGADTLILGTGMQGVAYGSASEGGDRVLNLNIDYDWIELTGKAFGGMTAGQMSADRFSLNTAKGTKGQIVFDTATFKLYWDADGTGKGAALLLATLTGVTHLTHDTFLIV